MSDQHNLVATDQGFSFDAERGLWVPPRVTPAPVAHFNADNPADELTQNGYVSFNNGVSKAFPKVDVEGTGKKAWRIRFGGNRHPENDTMRELRYSMAVSSHYTYEEKTYYQPKNYFHRWFWVITIDATPEQVSEWKDGDKVYSSNTDGRVAEDTMRVASATKHGGFEGKAAVWIENSQNFYAHSYRKGYTLTNDRTGDVFKILKPGFTGYNNKFSAQWVNKYSNGGMLIETNIDKDKPGSSSVKADISTSETYKNSGHKKNQLEGQPEYPTWIDTADNGSFVTFGIERYRSTSKDSRDAGYILWKKTHREGGEFPEMTCVFKSFGHHAFTTENNNMVNFGYILGWSNSGYDEDTDFLLNDWQLWFERPEYLGDI